MVLAIWLALVRPVWFLAAVAGWAAWHQRARFRAERAAPDAEAAVLRAIAAELAAGASLRGSLVAAAGTSQDVDLSRVARLAAAGRPMDEIADAVEESLRVNGRRAAAALHLAGRTGAAPRRVLDRLAAQAADLGALARERRALTAQARMSAALVGGAPVVLIAVLGFTGRLSGLLDDPAGRVVLTAGATLLLAGITAVVIMLARANR
jgi:Flp pilus assembly protein TadB